MKRKLCAAGFLLVLALCLTVTAFADSGPKPQLVIRVEHPPQEDYYLDLLAEGSFPTEQYDTPEEELDPVLLAALRAAIPDGWHGCISQGTTGAPIWGSLTGSETDGVMLHTFRYVGVPRTYRILIVTQSGETFLSDALTRDTLQSSATVDWAEKTASLPMVHEGYLLQLLATLLPTLLIEFALLALFGFSLRKSWKLVLPVNLVTQGLLHGYFALFALNQGVSWYYFLLYFPAEAVVTLIETCIYAEKLNGRGKRRAVAYGICANVCSAALGYVLAEPVWRFVVSLS